jgi:hypothetical protein
MVDANGVSVKVMAAITPFTIGFAFIPLTAHVYEPEEAEQDIDLPAPEGDEPIVAFTDAIAEMG